MGLYRFKPMPSGRMGIFWTLSGIKESAIIEFGCMGHNLYSGADLRRAGIYEGFGAPLYTTYIDETDISLGDTSRLDATIKQVIINDAPKVIFLQPSAVPEVIGTDLFAVANELQFDFPETRLIPIGHGSFAITQHKGVEEALLALSKTLPLDIALSDAPTYNIIGSCPDLFRYKADAVEITRLMEGAFGMDPCCILSSDTSISAIEKMGSAHVNLVIRREGIPAAQLLEKRFGTPYVVGRPYGIKGTNQWLEDVGNTLNRSQNKAFTNFETELVLEQIDQAYNTLEGNAWSYPQEAAISIGGHADVVKGVLDFATKEMPLKVGSCWCDCPEMGTDEIPYFSEKQWIPIVKNHDKGYLMFSGEALKWAGKNTSLQISNPDIGWRIHPYEPPFVGYRGAVNLVNLWVNEYALTH
ncbi:MAG: nitrogenase component 1 [Oscillospiraceae bacterium]|nr:nitrogenase component 1 [Oscillospiraceae bacterium]